MRRLFVSICLLITISTLVGCQARIGCRDCGKGGLLSGIVGRARAPMSRVGGCETGNCNSGGACANGRCGLGGGLASHAGAVGTGLGHHQAQDGPPGPPTGQYAYPYYTLRGPRDFLQNNPPSIGP